MGRRAGALADYRHRLRMDDAVVKQERRMLLSMNNWLSRRYEEGAGQ